MSNPLVSVCGICFEPLGNDGDGACGMVECCRRVFCLCCIRQWSTLTNACPSCSSRFSTIAPCGPDGNLEGTNNEQYEELSSVSPLDLDELELDNTFFYDRVNSDNWIPLPAASLVPSEPLSLRKRAREESSSDGEVPERPAKRQKENKIPGDTPSLSVQRHIELLEGQIWGKEREDKLLRCEHCSNVFKKRGDYTRHQIVHSKKKNFTCTHIGKDLKVCGKQFGLKGDLNRHVDSVHLKTKAWVCDVKSCGKSFALKGNLARHKKTVHGNERFPCTIFGCSKCFTQKTDLNRHLKIHSGEREHNCVVKDCGKKFVQKAHLRTHLRCVHHINLLQTQ